jgi:hypothetical protein
MALALHRMFCMDLKTDSGLCCIPHYLIGFYNRGRDCVVWTDSLYKADYV